MQFLEEQRAAPLAAGPRTATGPVAIPPKGQRRDRRRAARFKRWLRRAHMYAGLVMLPWLLFFGLSGVLFNHPNLGADVHGERVSPAELAEQGITPWDARTAAARVLSDLNAQATTGGADPLTLSDDFTPSFSGFTVLTAPAPQGRYMLLMDVERAGGVLVTRNAPPDSPGTSFTPRQVDLPEFSTPRVERRVSGLLAARGKPVVGELKAHPKIAPELRFRARDPQGTEWNLSYDSRSGEVTGRKSEHFPSLGVSEILGKMHTTHHFTLGIGSLWFWALFEDLLGLSMVFWALSGMFMWWQLKATRIAGAISFAVALLVAGVVMTGTLNQLTFGDVKPAMGPGE